MRNVKLNSLTDEGPSRTSPQPSASASASACGESSRPVLVPVPVLEIDREDELHSRSVSRLKILDERRISYLGVTEKSELIQLIRESDHSPPRATVTRGRRPCGRKHAGHGRRSAAADGCVL
jgi:hypothetical protein